jgi:fatty-acyl-CoA synthase
VYVKQVIEQVTSKSVWVLWDVIHTALEAGETPDETWGNIGEWIKYTHVKDGFFVGDRIQLLSFW